MLPSIVGYCYTALVPLILPAMSPPAPGSIAKECQDNEFLTRISKHWLFLRVVACWKYIFHTLTMLHYYSKLHFRYSQLILLIHWYWFCAPAVSSPGVVLVEINMFLVIGVKLIVEIVTRGANSWGGPALCVRYNNKLIDWSILLTWDLQYPRRILK